MQYLFGGIRLSGPGRKITPEATLQLSLLLAAFVFLKAVQYWYDRYELLFSNRGRTFTGASYTDVNAVLPAQLILMLIASICAIGFVVGAFTRSIKLPAIALGLLVLTSVLIGGVWPLVLQQVVVNPNGINREPQYIARGIDATRTAYQIRDDQINYVDYPGSSPVIRRRSSTTRTPCPTPGYSTRTCCRRPSPSSSSCGTSTASPTSWRWTVTRSTAGPRTTSSPCAS